MKQTIKNDINNFRVHKGLTGNCIYCQESLTEFEIRDCITGKITDSVYKECKCKNFSVLRNSDKELFEISQKLKKYEF